MTKEITKAFILQQMEDKFKLREFLPEQFLFSEMVIPVYNIGPHLDKWKTEFAEVSVTSGPGGKVLFTVPQAQRWTLRGYNVVFMGAGAYTVTGVYILRKTASHMVYLDMLIGQTVSYAVSLPLPVVLDSGDTILIYVDSYTSTQDLRLYIDYKMEELR